MRRSLLALLPLLASCGLLMDFEPGADVGSGGGASAGSNTSSIGSGDATSSSTGDGTAVTTTSAASVGPGGGGGEGGSGGADVIWATPFGGAGDQVAREAAVSPEGRVAIVGHYTDGLQFGTKHLESSPGLTSTFLAVFEPDGTPGAAIRLTVYDPSTESDFVHVGYDADENLYVTGSFDREVVLVEPSGEGGGGDGGSPGAGGGGDGGRVFVNGNFPDVFAASYLPDGKLRWAHRFGDANSQLHRGLHVTPDGRVFMVGDYCGNFGVSCLSGGLVGVGCGPNLDIFVIELDSTGACRSAWRYGDEETMDVGLGIDVQGDVVAITGTIDATIAFGGSVQTTINPGGAADASFLAVLDASNSGNGIDAVSFEKRGDVFPLLHDGNYLFAGAMTPPILGLGDMNATADEFVAGSLSNGEITLPTTFGGGFADGGFLRRTPNGALRAYGFYEGVPTFGTAGTKATFGDADIFITTLDSSGQPSNGFVEVYGTAGDQVVVDADFAGLDREVIVGNFTGNFDFVDSLASFDGVDVFVVVRPFVP